MRPFSLTVLLAAFAFLSLPAKAAAADDPTATVRALYHYAQAHFGFDLDSLKGEKPWLAPAFYARLWKKANEPVAKGDAPDIEGDVFLNSQEPLDQVFVHKSEIHGETAKVIVDTILPGEKRHVTVLLEKIEGAWKVTDVDYGPDGKLSDLLK